MRKLFDKVKKGFFALICCFLVLYLFPASSAAHAAILKSTPVQDPPEPTAAPVVYNETQNSSGALPGMPLTGAVQANATPLNGEQPAAPMNSDPLSGQKNWNLWLRIVEIIAAVFIAGYVFARTWIFRSED